MSVLRVALLSLTAALLLLGALPSAVRPAAVSTLVISPDSVERIASTHSGPGSCSPPDPHAGTLAERLGQPQTTVSNDSTPPERRARLSTNVLLAFAGVLGVSLAALVVTRRRALGVAESAAARRLRRLPTTLELGGAYFLPAPETDRAYSILSSYVSAGAKGLVLSRRYPDEVRSRYFVGSSVVLWLSRGFSRAAINPANLSRMVDDIEKQIAGREASVVLFDSLEYLVILNGAPAVSRFLGLLRDAIATHSSRLLVVLDPDAVTSADLMLLTRDFRRL